MYLNKFLYCVFALYSAVGLCAESKLPNIIVILADDLGFGDVQCNNPESKIPTPNIDRIANGGWSFPKLGSDDHSGLSPLQRYDLSVDQGETKNLFDRYHAEKPHQGLDNELIERGLPPKKRKISVKSRTGPNTIRLGDIRCH